MLPIDRAVVVQLTSRDVVHSFTLTEMRVKQDATPGHDRAHVVHADRDWARGRSRCSQLCGLGHYRMRGEYQVVSREDWDRWQSDEVERAR